MEAGSAAAQPRPLGRRGRRACEERTGVVEFAVVVKLVEERMVLHVVLPSQAKSRWSDLGGE